MTGLRWFLGITAAAGAAGWLAIALLGNEFRRSFGASGTDALTALAPPAAMLLALATVLLPAYRGLLHASAVLFALASVGLVWVLRESLFVGICGLSFLALWFIYYWRAAWS
ncbi:MAG: hypothetical protein HY823_01975 [Acidobacteria bacterium]|nr:hypothetical protein [Acidobacteriota bacterium]